MQRREKWVAATTATLPLFLLFATPSGAQTFRGSINGTITDPSGAVVPGAKATAIDVATGVAANTVSSGGGEFSFNDLPLDTYTIKVEAPGFQSIQVNGVQVLAGKVYTLPVKLNLAQQATVIQVSADALALDTTSTTQTTSLSSKALQDTPMNGRDFTQLLGTSASFAGYGSSGSVNGTRSDQVNYTIDGTDNNDLYLAAVAVNQGGISGIAGVIYPIDALSDYTLQTVGNSESGHSPGGNVNVSTKSGTNSLHGSAYYYNRNEALAVASPFVAPGTPETPLRNQNWGGSLGGPIWRDHTFFFLAYEEQKFLIGNDVTTTEPSTAYRNEALAVLANANGAYGNYAPVTPNQVSQNLLDTYWPAAITGLSGAPDNYASTTPETGYSHNIVAKIDHNFNDRNHLSARWFFGQGYQAAPDGSYLPAYLQVVPSHIQNYDVVYNQSLTPSLTNQVLAGVSYFTQGFSDAVHNINPSSVGLNTGITSPSLYGAPDIVIDGFDGVGLTPSSGRNDITGHISDIVSWTVGKHQLRMGLEYRRAYIDVYYYWGARGTFTFTGDQGPWNTTLTPANSSVDSNVLSLADFLAGYDSSQTITQGDQERFLYTHTGSGFVQDSWQTTPKLNLNFGVRYDYQQPFYTNDNNLSVFRPNDGGLVVAGSGGGAPGYIINSTKLNISPRIGFSWQPNNNGLVVHGNYGMYFDQPAGQAFVGNIGIANSAAYGVNDNPVGSDPVYTILNYGTAATATTPASVGYQLNQPVFPVQTGLPTGSTIDSIYSADPHFHTPYTQLFGLNIEQSFGKNWMLTLGYVGSSGRHNLVVQDINQSALGLDQSAATVSDANGNTFSVQQASRPYFAQYPNYSIINQMNSAATSSYNALQATVRVSAWHGLIGQFAYAWSHNLDDSTGINTTPQNSLNLKGDWGNSNYDVRNHFTAYLTYDVPDFGPGPKALTHGWELNSVLKFNTGEPLNIQSGNDSSGTGEYEDRGTLTGAARAGVNSSIVSNSYAEWLNPASFTQPAYGTYGNLRRNQIFGPGFGTVDLSLLKNTPIYKDRVTAQFRVEMFNIFNRVNLGQPNANLSSSSFGQSTDTIGTSYGAPGIGSGEPYNTQLSLKIIF